MNVREAFAVLGMAPTDDVDAIRATYKGLAKQAHPDVREPAGAPRTVVVQDMRTINQARDLLLEASQHGSLLVAAADPVSPHAPHRPTVDDLWRETAPAPQPQGSPPYPPPRGRRWDIQSRRAERSRRAAIRWLWAAAGLASIVLVLAFVRVPGMDRALSADPSSADAAFDAVPTERKAFDTYSVFLQILYPVCVVKWWRYTKRSLFTGTRGWGTALMAVAMVAALIGLFWGSTAHMTHEDDVRAGRMTLEGYAEAIAWDHVLTSLKAGVVLVLAVVAIFVVAAPRAREGDEASA